MNKSTLDRLKNNPHYKLSKKQQEEIEEAEREPMVEFGYPNINSTEFDKHPTKVVKVKRT